MHRFILDCEFKQLRRQHCFCDAAPFDFMGHDLSASDAMRLNLGRGRAQNLALLAELARLQGEVGQR